MSSPLSGSRKAVFPLTWLIFCVFLELAARAAALEFARRNRSLGWSGEWWVWRVVHLGPPRAARVPRRAGGGAGLPGGPRTRAQARSPGHLWVPRVWAGMEPLSLGADPSSLSLRPGRHPEPYPFISEFRSSNSLAPFRTAMMEPGRIRRLGMDWRYRWLKSVPLVSR